MQSRTNILKGIASLAPWLAPLPSCYFVARSSIQHLGIPLIIGIVIGLIVETMGFSTVHVYLMLLQWNLEKKKTDPKAPEILAFSLVILYIVITITLTVVLEIYPKTATFAPAIFPLLSLTGAFVLVFITQHEQRVLAVQQAKMGRSIKRNSQSIYGQGNMSNLAVTNNSLDLANAARKRNKETILNTIQSILSERPNTGVSELIRYTGVKSRTTIYSYLKELQEIGRISRFPNSENNQK